MEPRRHAGPKGRHGFATPSKRNSDAPHLPAPGGARASRVRGSGVDRVMRVASDRRRSSPELPEDIRLGLRAVGSLERR